MPHKVFNLGDLTATTEAKAVPLIPGIEPGGSQVGQPTKPALLIRDCWVEVNDFSAVAIDTNLMKYQLKLSQENDMTPGLILPIATLGAQLAQFSAVAVNIAGINSMVRDDFHAQGTIWVPRFVGVRAVEQGTIAVSDVDVHLDYERIKVPIMDWFIMWDFLDNVVDNQRNY